MSLVVSSLDENTELHDTLLSVYAGSVVPAETVVVDDGGTDGSCAVLKEAAWRERGVVVHRIERSGVAAARNAGVALTQSPYLLFLDAHCRLDRDCLARLERALSARPDAVLAPAVCDFDSTVYGCGARLIDAELRVRWLPPRTDDAFHPLPIAPGGCLALSRATFDRLNGFGSFRELGLEDIDFSLRAWRAGIDVLAVPSARLAHRFRPNPPYRLSSASRAYNVARVALVHFDGARREQCLRTVIGAPRAAGVLVDAFVSDWEQQRALLAATSSRTVEAFFDCFGDWR
ncbi:glycosyltransferase [Streptomyces sp. NPDC006197]|uniref:glycosyltransferase family 2 protein n=1 Tax=Streptomyces sp. NPDC006197 TaxID=3156685 RepID=UPI0033B2CC55